MENQEPKNTHGGARAGAASKRIRQNNLKILNRTGTEKNHPTSEQWKQMKKATKN